MAPFILLLGPTIPSLRALTESTILLGGLLPMTIARLGAFAFFPITAARLGGFTMLTVAAARLRGRAISTAGLAMLGGLTFITLPSAFLGALSRRTAQVLVSGQHRHISRRQLGRA